MKSPAHQFCIDFLILAWCDILYRFTNLVQLIDRILYSINVNTKDAFDFIYQDKT